MKNSAALVIGVLAGLLFAATAAAEDDGFSFNVTSDFFGKYVWRGQLLNDDVVYQPGISVAKGPLSVGIWGNLDTTSYNDREWNFSEMDYYLGWSDKFPGVEWLTYSVGVIYYDFPGSAADGSRLPDTTEVYWGLGIDCFLSPTVTVYHDVDEAEGSYVNFGLSHSIEKIFEITPEIPVGLSLSGGVGWGSASYNDYYWGLDNSKMQDFTFKLGLPMEIAGFGVTPSFNYVTLLSSDIRDTDAYSKSSDYFFFGISLSKSF